MFGSSFSFLRRFSGKIDTSEEDEQRVKLVPTKEKEHSICDVFTPDIADEITLPTVASEAVFQNGQIEPTASSGSRLGLSITPHASKRTLSTRASLERQGYVLREIVGEGTFSEVHKAFSTKTRKEVAIKIITRSSITTEFLDKFLPRETEIIKDMKHQNICRYYQTLDLKSKVCIVMELIGKEDLLEYVLRKTVVSEYLAKYIFRQIISGLRYLHDRNILHRDLKCENILLTKSKRAVITDFGFAKQVENKQFMSDTFCGSAAYAPLEILNGK